jgi:hypothetical protein
MSMEMQSGAMDMYGGYGSGPSSRPFSLATGTPRADAMHAYASSLISLMGGVDLKPLFFAGQEVAVQGGPYLSREAEEAFQSGYQGLALELMFGHMATEYDDALVAIKTVKYSAAVKRPVWAIRWGISLAVRGETDDAQPIREGATPAGSLARGGPGDPNAMAMDMSMDMADQQMNAEMESQMQQQMEMQMQQQMDMEMQQSMGMDSDMGLRGGAMGGMGGGINVPPRPSIPERTMLSAEAGETLDKTLGLVATVTAEEFKKRFERGDFGPVLTTVTVPAAPLQSIGEKLNDALSEAAEPLPMWQPGIVYVGAFNGFDEAWPVAQAGKIDLLLHFDVLLKPGRNNMVQNISRCRLLNVYTGKSMGVSKAMDNREAAQFAGAGRMNEREYVTEQLSNLLAIIDREVKAIDLPALTPDVAHRRIASLISGPRARSLQTLAEIRLYQAQGLIDASEVEAAFDIVGGGDALLLLHGAQEERIAMARKWAVQSQGKTQQP